MEVQEIKSFAEYFQDERFYNKIPDYDKGLVVYKCGDNIYRHVSDGDFHQLQSMHSNNKEEIAEFNRINKKTPITQIIGEFAGWISEITGLTRAYTFVIKKVSALWDWIKKTASAVSNVASEFGGWITELTDLEKIFARIKKAGGKLFEFVVSGVARAVGVEEQTIEGQFPGMGKFQKGTPFVEKTGPAIVHRGEAIMSAKENIFAKPIAERMAIVKPLKKMIDNVMQGIQVRMPSFQEPKLAMAGGGEVNVPAITNIFPGTPIVPPTAPVNITLNQGNISITGAADPEQFRKVYREENDRQLRNARTELAGAQ